MILRDEMGIICQHDIYNNHALDEGDSCNRTALLSLFGSTFDTCLLHHFHIGSGTLVRHPKPKKIPNDLREHDDPRGFSRDQLIPYVAALSKSEHYPKTLKSIFAKRMGRCFLEQNFDVLFSPVTLAFLIKACRIYWFYFFLPIGYLFLILDIVWFTKIKPYDEQNQFISVLEIMGMKSMYKKLHPDWKKATMNYWDSWRDQKEIGEKIIENF